MLTYQYRCEQNGETLEVRHRMTERFTTWGELCAALERAPGPTPVDTPVERLISGGLLGTVSGGTPQTSTMPSLPMAGCCGNPSGCGRHG